MNRHDIIKEIARHLTTEKDAKMAVHRIFEMMAAALRSNEKVVISNFGTFRVKERQPRQRLQLTRLTILSLSWV